MKRGDSVRLNNGTDKGVVLLSPSNVDGMTMCMVAWCGKNTSWDYKPRYTWEREEDLVCL